YQYMRHAKVREPGDVCLMVIADRMTQSFLKQARCCGVELAEAERGIWRGRFAGFTVHGVETGKAAERGRTEHLLFTFTRLFLEDPAAVGPLDEEEARVYSWLHQQAAQFRRARGPMAVKDFDTFQEGMMKMFESLSADHPELIDNILADCPPEKRLRGLSPEDRLRGLSPEDRLRGLTPEELERLR